MSDQRVSSPASTGGAGTFFEQHVGAYWLAQLLVRAIPPILIDCSVTEVHFQTERLGWQTDDFLVDCESSGGELRKLAGQVKRKFTVSATNDDCRGTFRDFWSDFKNIDIFRPTSDRFVLVTMRGSDILLQHFVGLLDFARTARDAAEFDLRLSTSGLLSKKSIHFFDELRTIVSEIEGQDLTAAEIWPFLRVIHLLSLDLDTPTSQTEASMRSALALTATDGNSVDVADASWKTLLGVAAKSMSTARSLRREDLPQDLQGNQSTQGATERRILRALKAHTDIVLGRIRSTLGPAFHLERAGLTQKVISDLEVSQVVILSGPAGSGKSAIAKDVIATLSRDHFTFGFRAEEFAQPHLDVTLSAAQIPANGTTLSAILAAQGRTIVLVESVERLLEKTTRDAFSDFIHLASNDPSMRVILTCRDYSVDLVRSSFLQTTGIRNLNATAPPLNDEELADVESKFPELTLPLKTPALRRMLRNPYFLDRALEIGWSADRPMPESERELRKLFWRQIVRADHLVSAGMAQGREQVFQEIAVRRARALTTHVAGREYDADILDSLSKDSLISSLNGDLSLVAPAHDVLEDWAILHWIEEQHLIGEGSPKRLAELIGEHPAVRRSYRKWLAELIDRNPVTANRLFVAALSDPEISGQFGDDTVVSILKAPSSPDFLTRHEAQLLANNSALLKRTIRLLRVACMTTPTWMAGDADAAAAFNVPDGPAWEPVLRLADRSFANFDPRERLLLLGLIEDAVRDVSWWKPDVAGAKSVAAIAYRLLDDLSGYGSEKARKRVLSVIAKVPTANPARFEAVLRGTVEDGEWRDPVAEDFRAIIFSGFEGLHASRELPEIILSIAYDHILISEADLTRRSYDTSSIDVEKYFGVKRDRAFPAMPASALRGPWAHLLRYHPRQALDFYVRVFNHCADWYAHPRFGDSLEPAREIELTFADGASRKQWSNARLWNLYRGTSVGPYVLQSLLMALESWLLQYAERYPQQIDHILVDLLRRSESACLAAVVASVATAHPQTCGEAILILLSAREYVALDLGRMVTETQAGAMYGMVPSLKAEYRFLEGERNEANRLSHRGQSLEDAVVNLQLGTLAPRVQALLDRHRAALSPNELQNDGDRTWRLAIHRMDLRQYTISDEVETTLTDNSESRSSPRRFHLEPKEPEPDVKAMMEEADRRIGGTGAQLRLFNWAYGAFKRSGSHPSDPDPWRESLTAAMASKPNEEGGTTAELRLDGTGILAAVCIRDHFEEMLPQEIDWCVERVCGEVIATANRWDHEDRVQRFDAKADRACARVSSLLLTLPLTGIQLSRAREAVATAVTHPNREVRWYAVWGIADDRSSFEPTLAARCINALAAEANQVKSSLTADEALPFDQRRGWDATTTEAALSIRAAFWDPGHISAEAWSNLDVNHWAGADAYAQILTILSRDPFSPAAVDAFVRAAGTLIEWWDNRRNPDGREPNFEAEHAIADRLEGFVMRTSYDSAELVLRPIIDAVSHHPREVAFILQGLTVLENQSPNTQHYWRLWELFADGVKSAGWSSKLSDEHSFGGEMLTMIFLTYSWKDHVRHWKSLEGHDHRVHVLFEALPPAQIVFDSYARFLYHIGEKSFPDAFIRLAAALSSDLAPTLFADSNTVFLLEVLLQRHVYGRPAELKREPNVRTSVLHLLDILVENGSAASYRMRDDFVTPAIGES